MFKKLVLALVSIVVLTSVQVFAESVPVTKLDAENMSLNLKWDASEVNDKIITVTVTDDAGEISDENYPDFVWVYPMPDDKQVDLDILLPSEIKSGTCYIYVDTKTQHHMIKSYVHNTISDLTKSICSEAYEIDDAEEFKLYAKSNAVHLGLDIDNKIISDNLDRAAELLFNEMSRHETESSINIYNSAKTVMGFVSIGSAENQNDAVNEYGEFLGIDLEDFNEKTKAVKNKFFSLVVVKDNSESDIKSVVNECLLLATLTEAENWSALKECVTENSETIGIDMGSESDYADIPAKRQYEVFVKLFETSSKLSSYNEFVEDFNEAVEYVAEKIEDEKDKNTNKGGGSSSSGKNSSSSVSVSNGFLNTPPLSPVIPFEPSIQTPVFNDIQGHFSESYVNDLLKYDAIKGYDDGSFRPDGKVTRAEFVAIAVRTFSLVLADNNVNFNDVSYGDWYYDAVMVAASNGLISGFDGNFNPNDNITRQEAAVILSKLMNLKNNPAFVGTSNYNDSDLISEWAKDAVDKVTTVEIMHGDNNSFRPLDSITRGETATVISRLAKLPGMISEVTK